MTQSNLTPPSDWPQQLLTFWFDAHGMDDWYGGGSDFDAAVRDLAGDWHDALRSATCGHLPYRPRHRSPPPSCSIRCAQHLSRPCRRLCHRQPCARDCARIVANGWDQAWPDDRRQFAYLPFEHSEDIADQRESLRLMNQLADPVFHDYAQKHFDIIERFGRFPHRNEALGRATRPDEEAAIEEGKHW